MLRSSMLSAGAVLLFSGLAYGQGSPEAAFKDFQEALKARNGDKAWGLLSKGSQKMMDDQLVQLKKTLTQLEAAPPDAQESVAEQFKKVFGMTIPELKKADGKALFTGLIKNSEQLKGKDSPADWGNATLTDVAIDGDNATAKIKTDKKTEDTHFVKEDGAWKLDMTKKRKAAPKAATKDDAKKPE